MKHCCLYEVGETLSIGKDGGYGGRRVGVTHSPTYHDSKQEATVGPIQITVTIDSRFERTSSVHYHVFSATCLLPPNPLTESTRCTRHVLQVPGDCCASANHTNNERLKTIFSTKRRRPRLGIVAARLAPTAHVLCDATLLNPTRRYHRASGTRRLAPPGVQPFVCQTLNHPGRSYLADRAFPHLNTKQRAACCIHKACRILISWTNLKNLNNAHARNQLCTPAAPHTKASFLRYA